MTGAAHVHRPYTLVAELTYRCPLRCAYCSNPVRLDGLGPELDTATWARTFAEAEALGVMQVNLTGGEPLVRDDLEQLVAAARANDLYTTLITSGVPLTRERLSSLRQAGLDGLQLSIQDVDADTAVRIAGLDAMERKRNVAGWTRALGIPLTLNVVLHRANLPRLPAFIALAEEWGVERLELAHVQYLGWALANRASLLPTTAMITRARAGRRGPTAHRAAHGDPGRAARLLHRSAPWLHGRVGTAVPGGGAGRARAALPRRAHPAGFEV